MPAATPLPRGPSVTTLYSAADLLTAPGCPVCLYAAESSDRYLRWFALEGHAQSATITRLCTSLGMCPVHTRRLMSQPGAAVRLTAVYRYVVTAARERLAERSREHAACPGCEHDQAAAQRALDTLLEGLIDDAVVHRCRELGGLCLPHLAAASAAARPRLVAPLAETLHTTIADPRARCDWLAGTDDDAETRALLRRAIRLARVPGPAACSACVAGAKAEWAALRRSLDAASNDPSSALALCASHLADAASAAAAGSIRPLLSWQMRCLTSALAGGRVHRLRLTHRRSDAACSVCRARRSAAQHSLDNLRDSRSLAAADAAMCVHHHLVLRTTDPRTARLLADGAIRQADQLAAELADAFDRLAMAHSTRTPAFHTTAWQRAAAFLDGSVFSGWCQPPPGGPLRQ